jgi:DNA ligase 1
VCSKFVLPVPKHQDIFFEIDFEGINSSASRKSAIAVRFPRIRRWRNDTPDNLKKILEQYG